LDWDEYAANWDADEAVRTYARAAHESLVGVCADLGYPLESARVCDFGCGTGLLSERLAAECGEIVAVDSSAKMIDVLRDKVERLDMNNIKPLCQVVTAESLEGSHYFDAPFDFVLCSSVCAFLDDYPGTLALLARELWPGGVLVQWDWELDPDEDEPFGLTRDAIRGAMESAGLEVLSVDTGFSVAFGDKTMAPLMGVGRLPT